MKTFTLKFLVMVCAFVVSGMTMGHAQEWNISDEAFTSLEGDIVETTEVDDLTIYANADKKVTIDANNKSIGDMSFTHRLKLGGSGSLSDGVAEARVLAFDVSGNTNISVAAMSSSGSADRELVVINATTGDTIGVHAAMGAELTMSTFQYEGDATTIYMYSPSSGVNVYYVKAAAPQLETLVASAGMMSPEFDPEKTAYQVNLPAGTTSFGLTATAAEGVDVDVPADITVADGGNYEMTVTASDGVSIAYTVYVHVQADGEILYVSSSDGVYSVAKAFDTNVYDALAAAGYSVTFASKHILTEEGFDYSPFAGMVLSGGMGSSRADGVAQNAYPIPCVSMQNDGPKNNKWGWVNDKNAAEYSTTKSYDPSNVQFKILNNEHPITADYEVDQMITWTNGTAESDDFLGKEIKYYNLTDSIPEAVALATIPGNDGKTMPTMWAVPKGTSVRSKQLDGTSYARTETASNVVLMYSFNDGLLYAAPGFDELLTKSLAWAIDGDDACVFEPFYAGIENLVPDPEGADISLWDGWGLKSIVTGADAYCGPSSILLEDKMGGEGCGWPDRSAALDVAGYAWQPNTTYHLRAMVKTVGGPIGFLAKGTVDNGDGDFGFGLDTHGEWMQVDTTFTTSATPVEGFFSFNTCDFASTATETYIDNYELYALPSTVKVAYVTETGKPSAATAADPLIMMLEADENIDLEVLSVAADATLDLSGYDVVIGQEAFSSSAAIYKPGGSLGMGSIPVPFILNKAYAMKAGRGFADGAAGSGGEAKGTYSIKVSDDNQTSDLFKGITFDGGEAKIFKSGAKDDGSAADSEAEGKGMQYATDVVISAENTLLANGINDPENVTVCINDIPSGATIGSETLQARMIAVAMNYGAICKDGGVNMTSAGLTLWRNAVYSLAGLEIPEEPVAAFNKQVAYVTSFAGLTAEGASDPVAALLEADENIDLTVIEHDANDTDGPLDLSAYDVVVAQEAFGSASAIYQRGQTLGIGSISVPFIFNKVYAMRDGRGFQDGAAGSGGEVEGTLSVAVSEDNQSNALFNGIEFTDGVAQLFLTGGDDNGGSSRTKGMQYATDVEISAENTLLASGVNDPENVTVCINDIPAGATIGSETLQARMITMAMNYGAMSQPGDMTSAGLTLWRNAVYSLAGLSVPTEPVEVSGGGAADKTVILVTPDDRDDEQYTWLATQGVNVEKYYPSTTNLSLAPQEEIDMLNAADLVIIGRSPNSGHFQNEDKEAWNALTAPVILNAQYVARNNRINWFNSSSAAHFDEEPAMAVADVLLADDPVFTYATPVDGKLDWSVAPNDMLLEVVQTNGTIVANFDYQENAPLFVRFDAGVAFYEGTEESPAAERVYFGFGNDNAGSVNFFPLTDAARNVYWAEIQRIMGLPITEALAAMSSDASLTNIEVSVGELSPAFTPLFTTFGVELPLGTTSVDITATTSDDGATVDGAGTVEIPEGGTSVVITVTAEDGTSTQTYTLNFTFESSVDDFANAWKVYPNPVNNMLNISGVDVKSAEVYNLSGSRMNVSARSMNQLDVSNLQQGAYIIKIQSVNDETAVLKFNKR